jgi:DNA-directed RNA polymerase subunit RPC12/RpoP
MKFLNPESPRKDEAWVGKQGSCHTCGAKVELEREDKPRVVYDQREGDAFVVNCPRCGDAIWINIRRP